MGSCGHFRSFPGVATFPPAPMADDPPHRVAPDWWAENLPRVRAFVQRRLRPELARLESPSDVVQSACRELLADLDREAGWHSGGRLLRWRLLRRALRKIVQKHRFHAAHRRDTGKVLGGGAVEAVLESASGPLGKVVAAEETERLAQAMQRLPERYQRVIEWVHFDRLPHVEVGQRMGRSEDASKMLLSRAMAKLAEELSRG